MIPTGSAPENPVHPKILQIPVQKRRSKKKKNRPSLFDPSVHRKSIQTAIIRTIRVIRVLLLLPDSNDKVLSIHQTGYPSDGVWAKQR
jgi:hypothetical protein